MQVYPGDPGVRLEPALTIERDGVAVASLACGTHTGTHLDAPSHTIAGGRTVEQLTPGELCGAALVLHVGTPVCGQRIGVEALAEVPTTVPPIVLLATGWDVHFGGCTYLAHPWLDPDVVADLQARGMHLLGVDTLNPDPTPEPGEAGDVPVHRLVLGADGVIVENLRGLTSLPARVLVSLLPLPLCGADGSPVRAVARAAQTGRTPN